MKLLKNAFLIVLVISNHSLSAMRALQEAQKATAQREQLASMSPTQRAAVAAPEQEKKAVATVEKFRIRKKQPKGGSGIKTFGDEQPIVLDLEKNQNYPTTNALTELLEQYVPHIPKVIVEKSNAQGSNINAMFVAYRNDNQTAKGASIKGKLLFFLKISKAGNEDVPEKLDELQQGPVGRFGFKALSNPELPIIVLQEMFFIYKGNDNKDYTIEVMHIAGGEALLNIIDHGDLTLIQECAEKTGRALGLFHVYFMNYNNSNNPEQWETMVHGDFHIGNVFFDTETSRVYFIDNGGMKTDSPLVDLYGISRVSRYAIRSTSNNEKALKAAYMSTHFVIYFIKGYLSTYRVDKRKYVIDVLQKDLNRLLERESGQADSDVEKLYHPERLPFIKQFSSNLDTIFTRASRATQ